ncbi:MAG: hypothetical protein ACXW29_09495 [Thermoanaerobaculia bacterium]
MRRIFSALLIFAAMEVSAAESNVLVQYSFDDSLTDTGPDTFAVFQHAKGHVRLSTQIRYSGYRSIELRDVPGDHAFPELQGYFPERKSGELFFHFAMLVVNPDQTLNVALAGPSHFQLAKDGIAFWLKTTNGVLHHVSDSIPKKLFTVDPFVWYLVDVRCDIASGTYDLTIRREDNADPLVALKDQPNAANAAGSSVDKFSFVGSVFEDDSDVTFYVDDVVLGTDEKVVLQPFVAPGRRKLFIDRWREAKLLMTKNPKCPPVMSLADFGLNDDERLDDAPGYKQWQSACMRMDAAEFASLAIENPKAPIFAISELMALARAEDHEAVQKRWAALKPRLENDVRYGMIAGIADLDEYYALLWKNEFTRAARLAEEIDEPEHAGDALFLAGSPTQARPFYEAALRKDPASSYWPTVKLSDIFHLLGDTANEKVYRQKMYGKLEE